MLNWVFNIIFGVFAGVFAGMGMGGGTFLIPLLIVFLSFEQLNAQSINLLAFIPMAICALVVHMKNKMVCYKIGLKVVLFSAVGAVFGVMLLNLIEIKVLKLLYAVFLLAIAGLLASGLKKNSK